jgi:hypothetical protein
VTGWMSAEERGGCRIEFGRQKDEVKTQSSVNCWISENHVYRSLSIHFPTKLLLSSSKMNSRECESGIFLSCITPCVVMNKNGQFK